MFKKFAKSNARSDAVKLNATRLCTVQMIRDDAGRRSLIHERQGTRIATLKLGRLCADQSSARRTLPPPPPPPPSGIFGSSAARISGRQHRRQVCTCVCVWVCAFTNQRDGGGVLFLRAAVLIQRRGRRECKTAPGVATSIRSSAMRRPICLFVATFYARKTHRGRGLARSITLPPPRALLVAADFRLELN